MLICHKWGAIKESECLGFSFGKDKKLYLCTRENTPQEIEPFEDFQLRQAIRDGKLDSSDLCSFAPIDTHSDVSQKNAYFPAVVFLIRDCKGNVKLCDAKLDALSSKSTSTDCANFNAVGKGLSFGVNFSAFIGNPILCG